MCTGAGIEKSMDLFSSKNEKELRNQNDILSKKVIQLEQEKQKLERQIEEKTNEYQLNKSEYAKKLLLSRKEQQHLEKVQESIEAKRRKIEKERDEIQEKLRKQQLENRKLFCNNVDLRNRLKVYEEAINISEQTLSLESIVEVLSKLDSYHMSFVLSQAQELKKRQIQEDAQKNKLQKEVARNLMKLYNRLYHSYKIVQLLDVCTSPLTEERLSTRIESMCVGEISASITK